MLTYTQFYLKEANLATDEPLKLAIDKMLSDKGIDSQPIKNWFMTQFIKWYKLPDGDNEKSVKPHQYAEGEPEWMSREGIVDFTRFEDREAQKISHIMDFLDTLGPEDLTVLHKVPYNEIVRRVATWDEELRAGSASAASYGLKEGIDFKPVFETKNAKGRRMRWVQLLTNKSYKCEGNVMSNCIKNQTVKPNQVIYSLYDDGNNPHVSLEVLQKTNITQIKGKGNVAPIDKYIPPTVEFVKMLMEKGYKVTGDGGNIGMVNWEGTFYFPDSEEWNKVYNNIILPKQNRVFAEIKKRIKVIAGESVTLIESYIDLLTKPKPHRYV